MQKVYDILLDGKKIGTTLLEKADAPMGVVFGDISFINTPSPYHFLKDYCRTHNIETTDHPEDFLIATRHIPGLQILNPTGLFVTGVSAYIAGMDSEQYEIYIEGIPYPFYQDEFPEHTLHSK